ncbi:hypothetical protein EIP91_008678 [Steccherinum ochraceum]|uniref:Uncharacterized protein n=1 Tax=Steccherinum ochraceum TaxID=92696 RepID=A0A4R0R2I7_9APHY|nr:hypothetical protein EIP91_008678 [Steccherinum ochraceum]
MRSSSAKETALVNAAGRYWQDKRDFLQCKGYTLRSKFAPGRAALWKGSRLDTDSVRFLDFGNHYNDIGALQRMIDAYSPTLQRLVYVRRIGTGSEEHQTLLKLSKLESWARRNPCPPVLDLFQDDECSGTTFIVIPYLRILRSSLSSDDSLWSPKYDDFAMEVFSLMKGYSGVYLEFTESDERYMENGDEENLLTFGKALAKALEPTTSQWSGSFIWTLAQDLCKERYPNVDELWDRFELLNG